MSPAQNKGNYGVLRHRFTFVVQYNYHIAFTPLPHTPFNGAQIKKYEAIQTSQVDTKKPEETWLSVNPWVLPSTQLLNGGNAPHISDCEFYLFNWKVGNCINTRTYVFFR